MTRQTGLIITIVAAVIFGCCALFSCVGAIGTFVGGGTYTLGSQVGQMPAWTGIFGLCFSVVFVAIPVALWYFLVRGKTDEPETAAAPPPAAPPAAEE